MINDRPVWVTIPTIWYSDLLIPLVNELERDRAIDHIILSVNLEKYVAPIQEFFEFGSPKIEVIETWPQGRSLHKGWNTAIELARRENAFLAVLNDDIRLLEPRAISHIAGLLSNDPSYAVVGLNWQEKPDKTAPDAPSLRPVHGSYRHYGVGGFAWVCDPNKVQLVPDDFVWWYGDDHIFLSAERDGHRVGIANHVHVEHVHALTANSEGHGWTNEAIAEDIKAFSRIWPGQ